MNKPIKVTIAAIVLMIGMALAQTNFNTSPQKQTTCTPVFSTFDVTSSLQTLPTSGNERGEITGHSTLWALVVPLPQASTQRGRLPDPI
jgi:hypothetical protein